MRREPIFLTAEQARRLANTAQRLAVRPRDLALALVALGIYHSTDEQEVYLRTREPSLDCDSVRSFSISDACCLLDLVRDQGRANFANAENLYDVELELRGSDTAGLCIELAWSSARSVAPDIAGVFAVVARFLSLGELSAKTALHDLRLLPEEQWRSSLIEGKKVPVRNATLHQSMLEQARKHPERIAARMGGDHLTYAELAHRTLALAHILERHGVTRDSRVGVLSTRCLELPTLLFGVLAAGAAYVPLDPEWPRARLEYIAHAADISLVLGHNLEQYASLPFDVPTLDVATLDLRVNGVLDKKTDCAPDADAYVIFTSGSTGRPKGVVVSHRSVINRIDWMQSRYPIGPGDTVLQKTPTIFDVSVWELFWWSQVGATMALMTPGLERFPRAIAEAIDQHGVTVAHFIPSLLDPFLKHLESTDPRPTLPSLKRVFCSGEALMPPSVERFRDVFRDEAMLTNLYGPTEATVDVTYYDCSPAGPLPGRIPIGRPIDNTRLYVMRNRAPVPHGVIGTLFIAGEGVAKGYARDPERTRESFVPDLHDPASLMYDTGDLVRCNADMELEFFGRRDRQIKIAGMRVELDEIEQVALDHNNVRACAATVWMSPAGVSSIRALIVAEGTVALDELRAHFVARLPRHMIPAQVTQVETLPRTASGKIDRNAVSSILASAMA